MLVVVVFIDFSINYSVLAGQLQHNILIIPCNCTSLQRKCSFYGTKHRQWGSIAHV